MTKPFHNGELLARIHAIIRRSKGDPQCLIQTGDLVVNADSKTVEVSGVSVHLTGKEYAMLELLSHRKGSPVSKEMFLAKLYGGMDVPEIKIIDVFICKLRKKLASASSRQELYRNRVGSRIRVATANGRLNGEAVGLTRLQAASWPKSFVFEFCVSPNQGLLGRFTIYDAVATAGGLR